MSATKVEKLLTAAETAEVLSIKLRHLKDLRARGEIRATKIGHLVRFRPDEIRRYQEANTEGGKR